MSNAARIVTTLDSLLTVEATLILYGRASIALGFENPPAATLRSLDVDALLTTSYESAFAEVPEFIDELHNREQYWDEQYWDILLYLGILVD